MGKLEASRCDFFPTTFELPVSDIYFLSEVALSQVDPPFLTGGKKKRRVFHCTEPTASRSGKV